MARLDIGTHIEVAGARVMNGSGSMSLWSALAGFVRALPYGEAFVVVRPVLALVQSLAVLDVGGVFESGVDVINSAFIIDVNCC